MIKIRIRNFINNNINLVFNITIIIVMVSIFAVTSYIYEYSNSRELIIEVKDKYVKNNDNNDKYIIIDTENNAYEITDLFFIWKFNSTDIYSSLEIGKAYKISITGIRCRIFSKYPNINKVESKEEVLIK